MPESPLPPRAVPDHDDGYFEALTREVFGAGLNDAVVEARWPAFRRAFADFSIERVAAFGAGDLARLLQDAGIVRNGRKIEATIANARTWRDLVAEHGSARAWLATTAALPWPERKRAVSRPFRGFGPSGARIFLWRVGESVPPRDIEATWTEIVPEGWPERA